MNKAAVVNSFSNKKYRLLGLVGQAQAYLGVNNVLIIKDDMFGKTKLNDLSENQLNVLLTKLIRIAKEQRKKEKTNG
jgi:hypothetical protein